MPILIREEQFGDEAAIFKITEDAFRGMPYAGGDEQILVDRLRDQNSLVLSLVAVDDEKQANASPAEKAVVGHIAFSIAINTDGSAPWYAFGPVSVTPERQAEGIGA
ncbi:MAG: N-acetyltransferase, partial [Gammaproteobacteria bacterium]|nr:N-acetyltransferase [Gammaproteobacteria bacterium]